MKIEQLNKIKCINGDCMDWMKNIPDKYFDLAIVDPPYGINISINMGRRKGDKNSTYHKLEGDDKSIPSVEYFSELMRVSNNQIIWGGNYMTDFLYPSSCWLLYDQEFSDRVSFAQFELAWTSFKSSCKKFTSNPSNIKSRIHPTEKPIKLYEWILTNYAKKGDKILDTHGGSFSHAIACDNLGFELDIIELDSDYYNEAIKRLKWHQRQGVLFDSKEMY